MKSINSKLVIYFSILILLSTVTLGLISIQRASASLTHEAEKTLSSLTFDASRLTGSRIEIQKKTLEMIALREDIQSMDWEIQQPILQTQLKKTNFIVST